MKVEEATDTIAKFFNDLIGAWVPGAVLAAGLAIMHLGPIQLQSLFKLGDTTSAALTFAGILFALGHALLAVHEQILKSLLSKLRVTKSFDEAGAKKRQSYEWFAELVKAQQTGGDAKNWSYNDLRSVALSVDPSAHNIQDPAEYTRWDLEAVHQSDIVLANMEASNPGGYSLALEVGFAKALGKRIFLVDQVEDPSVKRYFEMVRQCCERVFPTLAEALDHLTSLN